MTKLKKALFALEKRKMNSSSSSSLDWYWLESRRLIKTLTDHKNPEDAKLADYWMEDAPFIITRQ